MQGLEALYLEHGGAGFLPISVVAQGAKGGTATVDDAGLWADELGLTFPVVADTEGAFFPVWDPEGVLPIAYLVDRDGVLIWSEAGGAGGLDEIEAQVVEHLAP